MQISFTDPHGHAIMPSDGIAHCRLTNLNRELKGKTMAQIALKLNSRTWRKRMFYAASLLKMTTAPLLILAILICTARPASAQQSYQKVYVDHNNPTYVVGLGWTVGIQVEGDECPYPHPTASVTDITVGRTQPVPLYHPSLWKDGDGVWGGLYRGGPARSRLQPKKPKVAMRRFYLLVL